jgi:para-aminobenzoate synthetase component 2
LTVADIELIKPQHIVLSPGPGRPEEAGVTNEVIKQFSGRIPIFGICLGLQAIAQVFGGEIIHAPQLMHGKTSSIRHDQKTIFDSIANPVTVMRYHSLVVNRNTLPDVLEVSSESEDGVIMSCRHKEYKVEGVQFHPESFACEEGLKMIDNFIKGVGY